MRDVRAWWLLCVAIVAAALAVTPGVPAQGESAPAARPVLVLPVDQGALARLASIPDQNWRPGHRGVDIAASPGADAVAPGSGRVVFVGLVAGRDVMTIKLDVGVDVTLEPVLASVALGARVGQGDVVGQVTDAAGHCPPAACVHWGVKHGDQYLDPLDWLVGFGPVVLLPNYQRSHL